ncbi:hypothetical protein [Prevotella sp. HUN102]|nr:hypothetical protein [Prevotella sp. HUN102]
MKLDLKGKGKGRKRAAFPISNTKKTMDGRGSGEAYHEYAPDSFGSLFL